MSYQKFYTNQIHSSSLLCQLATMWKCDVLCDAVIKSGTTITKAHRVVMVAACPMLQSMEKASSGSHLEIHLPSEIKHESIRTFLQYLYEGFMMLTEENFRDVEKIGRLMQVDSVTKCCADFSKSLSSKTGALSLSDQYKYTFCDTIEFRHVRSSDLQKTFPSRNIKRASDSTELSNVASKRNKTIDVSELSMIASKQTKTHVSHDQNCCSDGASLSNEDPEIIQDSLELYQTEPSYINGEVAKQQYGVAVSVSSCLQKSKDVQVVFPQELPGEQNKPRHLTEEPPPKNLRSTPPQSEPPGFTPQPADLHVHTPVSHTFPNKCGGSMTLKTVTGPNSSMFVQSSSASLSGTRDEHLGSSPENLSSVGVTLSTADSNNLKSSTLTSSTIMAQSSEPKTLKLSSPRSQSLFTAGSVTMETQRGKDEVGRSKERNSEAEDSEENSERPLSKSPPDKPDLSIVKVEDASNLEMYTLLEQDRLSEIAARDMGQEESQELHINQSKGIRQRKSKPSLSSPPPRFNPLTSSMYLPPISLLSQFTSPQTIKKDSSQVIDLSTYNHSQKPEKSGDSQPSVLHKLTYISSRKPCTWCQIKGVKTKSGWYCYASHKCEVCDVPLCKQGRVCFLEYHKHIGVPDWEIVNPNTDLNSSMFF